MLDFEKWAVHAARNYGIAEGYADSLFFYLELFPHTDLRWNRYKGQVKEWWKDTQHLQLRLMKMVENGHYDQIDKYFKVAEELVTELNSVFPPKSPRHFELDLQSNIKTYAEMGLTQLRKVPGAL